MHRANPACISCHQMIDPIGLALENFDVTGAGANVDKTYAINDAGVAHSFAGSAVDAHDKLYDGTPLDGPVSLRDAIVKHSDAFILNLDREADGVRASAAESSISTCRAFARLPAMRRRTTTVFPRWSWVSSRARRFR